MGYQANQQKLSDGSNSTREAYSGCCYAEHAEVSAIKNLKRKHKNSKNKRKKRVNMLVIRVNNSGQLCNSKPCAKCLEHMAYQLKSFIIVKIYYSDNNGDIVVSKLSTLIEEQDKHLSARFRNNFRQKF